MSGAVSHAVPGAHPIPPAALALLMNRGRRGPWLLWLRRTLVALGLAFALGYLPYRVYVRTGLARLLTLQAELAQLQRDNQRSRDENRRLLLELEHLREDDQAIERVARHELGFIRPGELVYKIEKAP